MMLALLLLACVDEPPTHELAAWPDDGFRLHHRPDVDLRVRDRLAEVRAPSGWTAWVAPHATTRGHRNAIVHAAADTPLGTLSELARRVEVTGWVVRGPNGDVSLPVSPDLRPLTWPADSMASPTFRDLPLVRDVAEIIGAGPRPAHAWTLDLANGALRHHPRDAPCLGVVGRPAAPLTELWVAATPDQTWSALVNALAATRPFVAPGAAIRIRPVDPCPVEIDGSASALLARLPDLPLETSSADGEPVFDRRYVGTIPVVWRDDLEIAARWGVPIAPWAAIVLWPPEVDAPGAPGLESRYAGWAALVSGRTVHVRRLDLRRRLGDPSSGWYAWVERAAREDLLTAASAGAP